MDYTNPFTMEVDNPWVRKPPKRFRISHEEMIKLQNRKRDKFAIFSQNQFLDADTKRAALKASSSLVSLESYTRNENEELFQCSGIVIESNNDYSIILTSASLLRSLKVENSIAPDIKITVHLPDETSVDGQVEAYDLHFNLAAIRIKRSLPAALIRPTDDGISVDLDETHPDQLNEEKPFLRPHKSKAFSLIPRDLVVALGRYIEEPYALMAAPGSFCIDRCYFEDDFNCKVLFNTTCRITRCGIGGPLINRHGEVIGICFYHKVYTPFLPINVASLWLEHYKKHRQACRLLLGMEATNLYTAEVNILKKVIRMFPGVGKAVLVEEVTPGFSADSAGIKRNDVIIEFGGKRVQSFLELFESMWHKVGESVELTVVRAGEDVPLHLKMVVEEATPDNLYSWPLLKHVR